MRIHWLYLRRKGKTSPTTSNRGVLEITLKWIWCSSGKCGVPPSLPLLPDPLRFGVVIPFWFQLMSQVVFWKWFIFARSVQRISLKKQLLKRCKYERDSLTSKHRIILSELTRRYNQSIYHVLLCVLVVWHFKDTFLANMRYQIYHFSRYEKEKKKNPYVLLCKFFINFFTQDCSVSGVIAKWLDCGLGGSDFELHLNCYTFRLQLLRKAGIHLFPQLWVEQCPCWLWP